MSAIDQARPHGYSKAAKHARRHVQSIDSKQDHTSVAFPNAWDADGQFLGAHTVPGYYRPKNEKYFQYHPREKRNIPDRVARFADAGTDVARDTFLGFERDLEKEDIERWEKRREIRLQEEYDRWLARRFDITNPHVARWLRRIEPEFWDRRWAFLQDKMNIETFLTRIRLYGPQTKEDFEGLFSLWQDGKYADAKYRPSSARDRQPRVRYSEGKLARSSRIADSNDPIRPSGDRAHSYEAADI